MFNLARYQQWRVGAVMRKPRIMTRKITLEIECSGDFTERDLNEYVLFLLEVSSCSQTNPFVSEERDAEIRWADIL